MLLLLYQNKGKYTKYCFVLCHYYIKTKVNILKVVLFYVIIISKQR